jgi:T5SS/PEP-CTERM-associated repeat protein
VQQARFRGYFSLAARKQACFAGVSMIALALAAPAVAQSVTTTGSVSPGHSPNPTTSWTVNDPDRLIVGNGTTGSLTVTDGGLVDVDTSLESAVGLEANGSGVIEISGAGSRLSVLDGGMSLGVNGGEGTLTVSGEGHLEVVGEVTVTTVGNTTSYSSSDHLNIGDGGTGLLVVEAGGTVGTDLLRLGITQDSVANLQLEGQGSLVEVRENIRVGVSGAGTVVVSDGAQLHTQTDSEVPLAVRNSVAPDSIGGGGSSVLVTGLGTTWESGGSIRIGEFGSGALRIEDGGRVAVENALVVGRGRDLQDTVGPDAQLVVDNGTLEVAFLQAGDGGAVANLSFVDGATVASGGFLAGTGGVTSNGISYFPEVDILLSGSGTVWVNGNDPDELGAFRLGTSGETTIRVLDQALLQALGDMSIGDSGSGQGAGHAFLTIADAGRVEVAGNASVGHLNESVGSVKVSGPASTLAIEGLLSTGGEATGSMVVEEAGAVEVGGFALVGAAATGTGSVTVEGEGSSLHIAEYLNVGSLGEGTLRVADGGQVSIAENSLIGWGQGSRGSAIVTGAGSVWTTGGYLAVGNSGTATLMIDDGGAVISQGVAESGSGGSRIARLAGSVGTATVTGVGSLWDTGEQLIVGYAGNGTLVVRDAGTIRARMLDIALDAGSVGRVFIGGDDAPAAAGILDVDLVTFGEGEGTLIFNHTAVEGDDYEFTPSLAGEGEILHLAGVTNLSGNADAFSGVTTVSGGTLLVDGSLGGLTQVEENGTIGGSGLMANLVAEGVVAPGNSIGVLEIGGDLSLRPGSIYEVEIGAAGGSDRIDVGGVATVADATVEVLTLDAETSYQNGQTYRILNAEGGVLGEFVEATSNSAFLDTALFYGSNFVDLTVELQGGTVQFPEVASTYNQRESARALADLDQTSGSDALRAYNELLMLTEEQAREAFDLTSGEIHASGQVVTNMALDLFSDTMRLQSLGAARAHGTESIPMSYAPALGGSGLVAIEDAAEYGEFGGTQGAWLAGLAAGGQLRGDGNAADLDWRSGGLAAGYEAPLVLAIGDLTVGVAAGYISSFGEVAERRSSIHTDSFNLGVYGTMIKGPLSLSGTIAYAGTSVSTERHITFGGIDRRATADYWNQSLRATGELAYGFDLGNSSVLSPLATFDAGWFGHGGAEESGAGALSLGIDPASSGWVNIGLGLALAHSIQTEHGTLVAETRAVWEHALVDPVSHQSLSFAGGSPGFSVAGPDPGGDSLNLGLGLGFETSDAFSVKASYDGRFSAGEQTHGAVLSLAGAF